MLVACSCNRLHAAAEAPGKVAPAARANADQCFDDQLSGSWLFKASPLAVLAVAGVPMGSNSNSGSKTFPLQDRVLFEE